MEHGTPVSQWLQQHGLEQYAPELINSGAETLEQLVVAILTPADLQMGCPSIAGKVFHLRRFITAFNGAGGSCSPLPQAFAEVPARNEHQQRLNHDPEEEWLGNGSLCKFNNNYLSLQATGFVFPLRVFLFAFMLKGILPLESKIMTTVKMSIWAACCKATGCLYVGQEDVDLLATILNKLFPQTARVEGFKGWSFTMKGFFRNVRQNQGMAKLEVPSADFNDDPGGRAGMEAFDALVKKYPSLKANQVATVGDIGEKHVAAAESAILTAVTGQGAEHRSMKMMVDLVNKLMKGNLANIFDAQCRNFMEALTDDLEATPRGDKPQAVGKRTPTPKPTATPQSEMKTQQQQHPPRASLTTAAPEWCTTGNQTLITDLLQQSALGLDKEAEKRDKGETTAAEKEADEVAKKKEVDEKKAQAKRKREEKAEAKKNKEAQKNASQGKENEEGEEEGEGANKGATKKKKNATVCIPGEQDEKKMLKAANKICKQWKLKVSYEQAFKTKMAVKRHSDPVPATDATMSRVGKLVWWEWGDDDETEKGLAVVGTALGETRTLPERNVVYWLEELKDLKIKGVTGKFYCLNLDRTNFRIDMDVQDKRELISCVAYSGVFHVPSATVPAATTPTSMEVELQPEVTSNEEQLKRNEEQHNQTVFKAMAAINEEQLKRKEELQPEVTSNEEQLNRNEEQHNQTVFKAIASMIAEKQSEAVTK
jgi:hypothetical protein